MTDIPEGVIGSYKVTLLVDRHSYHLDPADWDWEALCGPDTKVVDCHLVGVRLDDAPKSIPFRSLTPPSQRSRNSAAR